MRHVLQPVKTFCGIAVVLGLFVAVPAAAAHAQTFSVLYNFGSNTGDPADPRYEGMVAQGRDGNLYSTAFSGGSSGWGAMFQITTAGTLTVPYSFNAATGVPFGGLTLGTDGNFYGTTYGDGASNYGSVFKITPGGGLTTMYSFTNSGDGAYPYAPPIQGADGNFYGTTTQTNIGYGTVYKITPSGRFTTLYSFDNTHGSDPIAPLVQGTDGNFYGMTGLGGTNPDYGVVYKITPSGKLSVIYNFDETHGGEPIAPLTQGSDGDFYGTTTGGGSKHNGVVFKITPAGKLTVLHNLNGSTDGEGPFAGLVQATDGNFYGTTGSGGTTSQGVIFRISPIKPYSYKVLYNFDGTTGENPYVTLIQHTSGILYGDTYLGGTAGEGTLFSLNVGLKPFVNLVSTSGKVGKTVEVLGQGFKGTTDVAFNGTTTTFKILSDTYLTATVPNGATTGTVTVTTPGGPLTSNKQFRVTRRF